MFQSDLRFFKESFEFNDKLYRQKLGTAIGKLALAYANLVMTRLEERLLDVSSDKPLVWERFIEYVFFIWTHGEEKLKSFINHLNSSHETIKVTVNFCDTKCCFRSLKAELLTECR